MNPQSDRKRVLKSLVALARRTRRTPSRREFLRNTGIRESTVLRFFSGWNAAVRAAGLKPDTRNRRNEDRELLEDWGRAVRKNGKCPTVRAYHRLGKFGARTLEVRFGCWSKVREAFRKFARDEREWADVLAVLPGKTESGSRPAALHAARPPKIRHPHLPNRPIYGHPMDFRGLRHEPVNEQGVVLLFGMVAKELGYIVEAVQSGFPDCEAKRQIAPGRWQHVHLEFEFESRNFRDHGHPPAACDVLVCWRHNWPNHPHHLEILELSSLIPSLPANKL